MFFRGRQGRETPASEESLAVAGEAVEAQAADSANSGQAPASQNLGDPTHRLLAALGRFQRQMARARDGLPQEEWSDECMNQLINATEIAVEQGWREVRQILTETARILSSYEAQGRANDCLEFLGDSYEILCNLVGDLITGSLRPTVVQRWNDRHAQALEELSAAGIPLIDGEEPAGPVEAEEEPEDEGSEVDAVSGRDEAAGEIEPVELSGEYEEDEAGSDGDIGEAAVDGEEAEAASTADVAVEDVSSVREPLESGVGDLIEIDADGEQPDGDAAGETEAPAFSWREEEEELAGQEESAAFDEEEDEGDGLDVGEIEYEEDLGSEEGFDDETAAAAVLRDWDSGGGDAAEEGTADDASEERGEDTQERLDELNRAVEELIEDLRGDAYPPPSPAGTDDEEELAVEGFLDEDRGPSVAETAPPDGTEDATEEEPPEAEEDTDPAEGRQAVDEEALPLVEMARDAEQDAGGDAGGIAPGDESQFDSEAEPEAEPASEAEPAVSAAKEPVEGSFTASGSLPGDVAQLLDGFCEEVAGLSTGENGDIHAVVGRLQGMLEALENRATEMAKDGAVLPCLAMGRLVRLIAGHEAVPDDRFYSLAYDFAGLYKDAGGRSNEPRIQHWLAECDRLLVSWASAQRGVTMPEPAAAPSGGLPEPAPEGAPGTQAHVGESGETPLDVATEAEPPSPAVQPKAAIPPELSTGGADKPAGAADRSGLDTEALLETARKAILEGNTANAKLLAMQAAAQIAFQQAREAEQAVERAEQRLKQGIADSERAAQLAKQREQSVRDAQAAVSMSEGEVVRAAGKTRETANEVEHVEAMLGEIDEQIEQLQRQRTEAAGRLKETETRLASSQSEEARAKEELERRKDEEMHARIAQEEAVQDARSMAERRGRLAEAMEEARAYLLSQRDALADIEDTISQVCSAPPSKGLPQDELPFE